MKNVSRKLIHGKKFLLCDFFWKTESRSKKKFFPQNSCLYKCLFFGFKMCPKCVQQILIKTAFIFKNKNPVASKLSPINSKLNFKNVFKVIDLSKNRDF
jgi:hypothetical protein